MNFEPLYDRETNKTADNGKTVFSDYLYIPPGKVALVSLFDMQEAVEQKRDDNGKLVLERKDCIKVYKLSLGKTGDLKEKIECNKIADVQSALNTLLQDRRIRRELVTQCGENWIINPCNNLVLITVPGVYMLELYDEAQFDSAYIEYSLINAQDSIAIPDSLKLGH